MSTLAERIIEHLRTAPGPLDDDELAVALDARRRSVNQACRELEAGGVLCRRKAAGGKFVNLIQSDPSAPSPRQPEAFDAERATERLGADEVKRAVADHLSAKGYTVAVAWGRERGVDVDAVGPADRIVIEAKGEASTGSQQVTHFLCAVAELVQRMSDPEAIYALAFPDRAQYRSMVDRLPPLARERLNLRVYFVSRDETGVLAVVEA